jgi:hypothetical protein
MKAPGILVGEDGSIVIEWIKKDRRFAIYIEADPTESSWYYVEKGKDPEGDLLPIEIVEALKKYKEKE